MTDKTIDEIMIEAEDRVHLKRSLRVRDIEFDEDVTTTELREMVRTAPFDNRYDM